MSEDVKDSGGVTRSQNVVFVVPHDWASISYFLAPLIERVDETSRGLQLLVLTADSESAASVAAGAVKLAGERNVGIIAATSMARTTRLLKTLPSQVVVGPPQTILDLVKGSALKLEGVKAVAFAWADAILAEAGAEDTLATLLADLPKDSARTIATTEVNPAVESLIERYARRARRVTATATNDTTPISLEYVITGETARTVNLRRLLDTVDPENAAVFVRNADTAKEVEQMIRSLGYSGDASPVRVSHGGGSPSTVVLFDLPASREELTEAMGAAAKRVIAFIQPRQLSTLRNLAGGGRVKPLTLPDSANAARERDQKIRAELRAVLTRGSVGRTLFAIEPLLEEYDAVDVAAAALELLENERARPVASETPMAAAGGGMARLFFNVGARDGLRVGEVVAGIGNDAGVPSPLIGKIDVRDTHTIVEVGTAVSAQVIEKLSGKTMAGRRLVVRADQDPGERERTPRSRDFAGKGGPKRDGPRGAGAPRGRPPRGDGPPRSRPPRGGEGR